MTPAIGTPTGWSVAKVRAAISRNSTTPTTWNASSASGLNRSPTAASRRSKNGSQTWSLPLRKKSMKIISRKTPPNAAISGCTLRISWA